MTDNASRSLKMRELLQHVLSPSYLEIIDDSHHHRGHVGAKSGAGHFTIKISSERFKGKSPIECHRLVYQAVQTMMPIDIHALSIKILKV